MADPPVVPDQSPSAPNPPKAEASPDFTYPSGGALNGTSALAVTLANLTRLVVVAGPVNTGKTTLLASLYERFHYGPFAKCVFSGSTTLVAFEERTHLARRASGRDTPDTKRTPFSSDLAMLHLALKHDDLPEATHLLFTDISGETFRLAADSTDECQRLTFLRRADHLAILIDSANVLDPRLRQEVFTGCEGLLRSCLDGSMLDVTAQVELVLTKWDVFAARAAPSDRTFLTAKLNHILGRYSSRVALLTQFEVAARPAAGSTLRQGHGLDKLLDLWVQTPRRFARPFVPTRMAPQDFVSEFDRFSRLMPPSTSTTSEA
jgi:hypothetical protein